MSKKHEKTMQKRKSKNGHRARTKWSEPQSARAGAVDTHFLVSEKTCNSQGNACISDFSILVEPFSSLCFSVKSKKGSKGRSQRHKNTPKWIPRAPKQNPIINKLNPKVPQISKRAQNDPPSVAKRSPRCYNGVPRPPKRKKSIKSFQQCD